MRTFNQSYEMKLVSGSKVSVEPCKHLHSCGSATCLYCVVRVSVRTQSCGKPLLKMGSFSCSGHPSAFLGYFSSPPSGSWSSEIPATRCHFLFLLKLMAPGVLPSKSFTFGQGAVIPAIVGIKVSVLNYKAGTGLKRREYQTSKFNLSFTTCLCLGFKQSRTAGSVSVTGYWPR